MGDATPSLVAQYWTVSGRSPADAEAGEGWSRFGLGDRCASAQRMGFRGIGLFWPDLEHQLKSTSLESIGEVLRAHDINVLELEYLWDWFLPPGDPRREASDAARDLLFDAAAALGARHIKVGNLSGAPCPAALLTERFAELCALASERHDSIVVYEFTPFDPVVDSVDAAITVIGGAGARNGALTLDTWHLATMGVDPQELARIPPELIGWVELSDGTLAGVEDLAVDCVDHRAVPGDGDFPIPEYIRAIRGAGYDGPWGVEVLSAEFRKRPMDEMLARSFAGGERVMRLADAVPGGPKSL